MRTILIEGSLYSKIQGDDVLFKMALERNFGKESVVHYVDAGYGYCQNLSEAQSYDKEDIIVTNNVLIWGNSDLCFDGDGCFAYIYDGKYGEIFHVTDLTDYPIGDLVEMYTSGLLFGGIPDELTAMMGIMSKWILNNTTIEADDDFQEVMYKFADYLIHNGVRFVKNNGIVICEGEVSVCPPELVDKVRKVLG